MIATAVRPMVTPIKPRRRSGLAIAWWSGEPGCSSSITQSPATTMNTPSPTASIRYSGQCWRSASRAPSSSTLADATLAISAPRREFGVERHTAVDEQRDAIDIVAVVPREPDGGASDIFGLADALVGHKAHQRLIGLRRRPRFGVYRGAGGARGEAIHPDSLRRQFLGDRLHQHHHAALRCRVIGMAGPGDDLMHRAHADYLAEGARDFGMAAAAQELTHRRASAEELTGQVDANHGIPLRQRHFRERRVALQPRIGDNDVQRAEGGARLLKHCVDLILARNVGAQRDRPPAGRSDLVRYRMSVVLTDDIINRDRCAGLGQRDGDRLADPGIGTGDKGALPGQRSVGRHVPADRAVLPDVHLALPFAM